MRTRYTRTINALITAVAIAISLQPCYGQDDDPPPLKYRRLIGPRIGLTAVVDQGPWMRELQRRHMDRFISQFGWHHEWVVSPQYGGPAFVIESITFLGGMEYGTVIPSQSVVLGIRMPGGFEFGMGPNAVFTDKINELVVPSLILALGKSIDFNGVSIPLNLAWNRNNGGNRLSFVFGYALPRKA
jgi:hypothetical protein